MKRHQSSSWAALLAVSFFILPMLQAFIPVDVDVFEESTDSMMEASGRAQTTWSGTQSLSTSYTVAISDELIIQSCTVVQMSGAARIIVEGRLTILGTQTCPVTLEASGLQDHEGIQFNASSNGRGSVLQNLTITDSIYGMTIYGSNPVIENLTVVNPDRVAVDMFNNAAPRITDLYVNQAGRDLPFQGDWRYGLGLSIGAGSTPIVTRAVFSDILTRAVNIWGGSGGLIQGITVDNCSGSTYSMVAGIWVEDSQPLLTNISIDKSDTGIVVRHIDDEGYTHAVIRHASVSNSMYRGVYVDKNNHTNYTNYETADFTNLTITGTGTSGAKTANIGYAALEVNATGAWFDDTVIEDSTTVGVRLYFVDDTTTFRNLTVRNSGDPGQGPHEAGLAIRSSFFAPNFEGLEISGSVGPGISSTSGGAMQGSDWNLHNNTEHGLFIDRATVVVDGLNLSNNQQSGAQVWDARYVTFENLSAHNNGGVASSNPLAQNQAGLYYEDSNDIESGSGDVRCRNCLVTGSTGAGILAVNSVDLWLENITLQENSGDVPALEIDNTDTMPAGALGRVTIAQASITSESPTQPALELKRTAASITGLTTFGNNTGFIWQGNNNGNYPSSISQSTFSGTHCLHLIDHPNLNGTGNTIASDCTGNIEFENSQVNWSNLQDADGQTASPHLLTLDATSDLHLHQPQSIDVAGATVAPGATIDVAWDLMVWAVNNFSNGIPMASINVSFSDFEPSLQLYTNDLGYVLLPDFIGQRWTSNGATSYNTVTSSCGYDSVSNSTTTTLDQDQIVYCLLELDNQAPFVNWDTPFDGMIYPSKGEILFNASRSWDLDNDPLSFTWTSSIDGDIVAGCAGVFQSPNHPADGAAFLVNGDPLTQVPPYCELSDGIHAITLGVCDPLYCVGETRTIELVNLAPALMVEFEPGLNPWSELIMPQTGTVVVNTTGSFDPEGDDFACVIDFNGEGFAWGSQWVCPEELTYTFDYTTEDPPASAELTVMAFDAVGNNATYSVPVILYNEIPEPSFTIARDTNSSESLVTLDGSATIDPEGDSLTTTYISSLDGILNDGSTIWEGYLSRGVHTLTMEVTDDRAEHANQSRSTSTLITVENSLPRAIIGTPVSQTFESSELIEFSANGSGDFDAACDTFPTDGAWHCAPFSPFGGSEFLVVTWTSDLDGRLTPEGEDWLYFDGRLTAGVHTITLSVDDGIHDPVLAQQTVTIVASAPVLGLVSPLNGSQSLSSQTLMFDASQSLDYDGDAFTVTLRSSLHTEPLLVDVDPFNSHAFNLKAGQHILTVTLTDESGDSRDESFVLTVVESEPTLVLISPENRASIEPGGVLRLEEASFDADNDLTVREWRKWSTQTSFPEVLSTSSIEELSGLTPGEYHLSLYVEDARGQWVEEHVNITIQSSLPSLDRDSLSLSETTFSQDELHRLTISIRLEDADGTTQDVRANLTLNIQQWEVNLTDEDGDGVWEGVLEWRPESTGRPSLKIIAKDGQGETANVDVVTRTLVVEVQETDQRALVLGASLAGLIAFVGLLAFVLARRKRALEDIDLLASWDAFRAPAGEANTDEKNIPSLEENIMDGTEEVQATLEELE